MNQLDDTCIEQQNDMIIFLDFDGVLHPNLDESSHFCCAPLFWELLRRHPEARVVFSTGWRFEHSVAQLGSLVCSNGGEDLAARFIDATPLLRHETEAGSREKDCRAWLQASNHTGPWLALDDMRILFSRAASNLYHVNPKRGLMPHDVERISSLIRMATAGGKPVGRRA